MTFFPRPSQSLLPSLDITSQESGPKAVRFIKETAALQQHLSFERERSITRFLQDRFCKLSQIGLSAPTGHCNSMLDTTVMMKNHHITEEIPTSELL